MGNDKFVLDDQQMQGRHAQEWVANVF